MRIIYFEEKAAPLWESFVRNSRNGTFMQTRLFLNYHPSKRFTDRSLLVFDRKEHLLAVIPAASKVEGGKQVLVSHPGASHGGIIVGHNIKTNCVMEIISQLQQFARQEKYHSIILKMVPYIYHKWPSAEIDYALRNRGFKLLSTELATAVPLQRYHLQKSDSSTRRNVRKALKNNLIVKETAELKSYWEILTTNLQKRHQVSPTHSYDELLDLMERFKDQIKLFGVYQGHTLIAGAVVFILNRQALNCFYIAHLEEYQALRPLDLLFHWLIQWGTEQGYRYLDWGISTEQQGSKLNSGLIQFKEGFGGRGVLRETYSIVL